MVFLSIYKFKTAEPKAVRSLKKWFLGCYLGLFVLQNWRMVLFEKRTNVESKTTNLDTEDSIKELDLNKSTALKRISHVPQKTNKTKSIAGSGEMGLSCSNTNSSHMGECGTGFDLGDRQCTKFQHGTIRLNLTCSQWCEYSLFKRKTCVFDPHLCVS